MGQLLTHFSQSSRIGSDGSEMSSLRRRSSSPPPPPPPLEDNDLLPEILLLLPPHPCSLPRASAVCKRWRRLVSDDGFFRRFRRRHRRNPLPLLGFFSQGAQGMAFEPTMDPPNRVPPGRFSLQRDHLRPLGCRHGLVLMLDRKRKQVVVWDPINGDQRSFAVPTGFDPNNTEIQGAVLRAAGDVHFQAVLVVASNEDELHPRVLACVYSSETGLWGDLLSAPLTSTNALSRVPAVLVGDSLYWTLVFGKFSGILQFDLERQSLAVIQVPVDTSKVGNDLTVMRAEGGGLGFLLVSDSDLSAQLWKRKTGCDGVASWELRRTIELDKLLSLNPEERAFLMITASLNLDTSSSTKLGYFDDWLME